MIVVETHLGKKSEALLTASAY